MQPWKVFWKFIKLLVLTSWILHPRILFHEIAKCFRAFLFSFIDVLINFIFCEIYLQVQPIVLIIIMVLYFWIALTRAKEDDRDTEYAAASWKVF